MADTSKNVCILNTVKLIPVKQVAECSGIKVEHTSSQRVVRISQF